MKTIFNIAKTELRVLFYSPVGWLILVIFVIQTGLIYIGLYDHMIRSVSLGWRLYNVTIGTFATGLGPFMTALNYLYLYIPLLSMGIMSREYASGSIKLLYSSPLTNYQIILGKYLALMAYGLLLVGVLSVFGLYSVFTVDNADIPLILSGLLGVYLLICAYAAIGLFMSSLTSYTVVSAIGTFAILALLGYVKTLWQDVEFVRDVTYWLAISGRSETFIEGLLTSEDILYFIIVIGLFLGFTIIKLQSGRQKNVWYLTVGKYVGVFLMTMLLGYLSSKPSLKSFYDVTRTKANTLTEASQKVMVKLDGRLTIHTYVNMLYPDFAHAIPRMYKDDVNRFKQYIRFKPDMKMKHHYYYHKAENPDLDKRFQDLNDDQRIDTLTKLYNWTFPIIPYRDIQDQVDLAPENFRFVRELVRENGQRTFLRIYNDMFKHPFESEITAAFKRLALDKLPIVGFVTGRGERSSNLEHDRGYNMLAQEKTFRYALINQGFEVVDVTLVREIPDDVQILIVAEPRQSYTAQEQQILNQYIAGGGNMIVAGEPRRQGHLDQITESIGVRFLPGVLVKPSEKIQPELLILSPTPEAELFSHHLSNMARNLQLLTMPTASALEYDTDKGFEVTELFRTDSTGSWNELQTTDFVDDSVRFDPATGEEERAFPTVLALSRQVNGKEQRILVTGDADWLSNSELGMNRDGIRASNFSLINAAFFWLSEEEVPIDMRRPPAIDNSLSIGKDGWAISRILLKWIFPGLLIIIALVIWIRRRGR